MFHRRRIQYWGCSEFAAKLRAFLGQEKKPKVATWEEWESYHTRNDTLLGYLTDDFLNKLQDIFMFPYDVWYSVKCYVKNRWVTKTHFLKTGLKPGQWYDLDYRILFGMMNELKEYVEKEKGGVDEMSWELNLKEEDWSSGQGVETDKPSSQALAAQEAVDIYHWWIERAKLDDYDFDTFEEDNQMLIRLIKIRCSLWT
jgi:hypothetical protein